MSADLCRCCMARPPDKDLMTKYTKRGKQIIYRDVLKECFEIHILENPLDRGGICDLCIMKLLDANDFKQQVLASQKHFHSLRKTVTVDVNKRIKKEQAEDANEEDQVHDQEEVYLLDVKNEYDSDFEMEDDADDDKKLSDLVPESLQKGKAVVVNKPDENLKKTSSKAVEMTLRALILNDIKPLVKMSRATETKKQKNNLETIMKYSNCTPFLNKTLSGIICIYCKGTLSNPQELRAHVDDVHKNDSFVEPKKTDRTNLAYKMDITDLKCTVCNKNFDLIASLKEHLIKEHDIKFHSDVKDYIIEFKLNSNELLSCALCNSTYETFKMLLQHMNRHYRNYVCEVCDAGFINMHRLKNHQRTHDVGSFKCSYCNKEFTTKVRQMCHEKYTHNTNARYNTNCPQCDKSFNSYYRRNRHMFLEHNSAPAVYKCNVCEKSFILKAKLTAHIKKVHLMEKDHICQECGQGFFLKQCLVEHMIKHKGERVFKCTVCCKAFARKKTLREHMRIHNNDRRFKCGICGSAFIQKCSLKGHLLSNHGFTLAEYEMARADLAKQGNVIN